MAMDRVSEAVRRIGGAVLRRDGGPTDAQLLADYVARGDEAALATLVRRHAAMVWGVCHRVLRDHHDAEDAFQATFLVFVRRAASIDRPELLASWLYGVAHRTALKARATRTKRQARERQVADMPEPPATEQVLWDDLQPLLDRELSRLPAKYRVVIILCELEGKTRAEAARQLGVPDGTLAARLSRGRVMLAARLARRGLAVSATALAVALSHGAASAAGAVPVPLVTSTVKAVQAIASSSAPAVGAPAHVVMLADEAARGLSWAGWKSVSALVVGAGVLAAVGLGAYRLAGTTPPAEPVGRSQQSPAPLSVAGRSHWERLQGEWRVVASELDGVKDFDDGRSHDRLAFDGDRVTYQVPKGPQAGRFRLDASTTPVAIDIEFDNGAVLRGVCEFDGARLRFCWTKGGSRPASFDTATGELLTFCYTYVKTR